MASSGPADPSFPQIPWLTPDSVPDPPLDKNLDQWVNGYFTDLASGSPGAATEEAPASAGQRLSEWISKGQMDGEASGSPYEIPQESQSATPSLGAPDASDSKPEPAASDSAVSGSLVKHTRNFFGVTENAVLPEAQEGVLPQKSIFVLLPAAPMEGRGKKPYLAASAAIAALGRRIRGQIYRVARIPVTMSLMVWNFLCTCGMGAQRSIRRLFGMVHALIVSMQKFLALCGNNIRAKVGELVGMVHAIFASMQKFLALCRNNIRAKVREFVGMVHAIFASMQKLPALCGKTVRLWTGMFAGTVHALFASMQTRIAACGKRVRGGLRSVAQRSRALSAGTQKLLLAWGKTVKEGTRSLANLPKASRARIRWDRRARKAVAPVLLLVLMGAFLVSTLGTMTRNLSHAGDASTAAKSSNSAAGQAALSAAIAANGSHLRVTDPAVSDALANLSHYEVGALKRQAEYGDEDAAFLLAMAYETGARIPQSCAKAFHWVTIAADGGNVAAEFNLGLRYENGDGISANQAEGTKWLEKAASQNYPLARSVLLARGPQSSRSAGLPR
jgi:hypothetical protein